jgi:hypothetical protein
MSRGIRVREGESLTVRQQSAEMSALRAEDVKLASPLRGRRKCCVEGCRRLRARSRARCKDHQLALEQTRLPRICDLATCSRPAQPGRLLCYVHLAGGGR